MRIVKTFAITPAEEFILDVPFTPQRQQSGTCVSCALKMVVDYWGIDRKPGTPHSIRWLNKILGINNRSGGSAKALFSALNVLGMRFQPLYPYPVSDSKGPHVRPYDLTYGIIEELQRGRPLLASFFDEYGDGHSAVIVGYRIFSQQEFRLVFHDPWPEYGKYFERDLYDFFTKVRRFRGFIISVFLESTNIVLSEVDAADSGHQFSRQLLSLKLSQGARAALRERLRTRSVREEQKKPDSNQT